MTVFKYFTNVACETNWCFIDILISISIIMSIFSYVCTPFLFIFYELPFISMVLLSFGLKE